MCQAPALRKRDTKCRVDKTGQSGSLPVFARVLGWKSFFMSCLYKACRRFPTVRSSRRASGLLGLPSHEPRRVCGLRIQTHEPLPGGLAVCSEEPETHFDKIFTLISRPCREMFAVPLACPSSWRRLRGLSWSRPCLTFLKSGILLLGNVKFDAKEVSGVAEAATLPPNGERLLRKSCDLLFLDRAAVQKELLTRIKTIGERSFRSARKE